MDPKKGIFVVYHGKYWSILDLSATISYLEQRTPAIVVKSTTEANTNTAEQREVSYIETSVSDVNE